MPLSPQAKTRLSVLAAIAALPLLYFHRASFSDEIFISRDILRVYYPLKKYWVDRVSQGQFPDWYSFDGLGQPYAGMLISGAFHPANLFYLVLSLGGALKLITLLSYMAALGGTYLFGRLWGMGRGAALLSGLTYALCGYMVGISNNLLYLMAAATFPWALWGAERFLRQPSVARAAAAAIPLALVLLSGDPQSFAMCNGMILVLVLLRPDRASALRVAPRAGLLIGLGALLSAVQILPVLSILREVNPSAPNLEMATFYSFHPLRLLELVLGPLYIDPESGTVASGKLAGEVFQMGLYSFWVSSVHVGFPALLLVPGALWAHRRDPLPWKLAVLALFVFALALGHHLPLYRWFYEWVPLWSSFRYPEKLLPYFLFLCALGAGAGVEALGRDVALSRRLGIVGLGLALVCGLLALGEWRGEVFSQGVIAALWKEPLAKDLGMIHGNFLKATLLSMLTLVLLGVVLLRVRHLSLRAGAFVVLQFALLYVANESTYHLTYKDLLEQPTGMVDFVLRREASSPEGEGWPRVYGAVVDLEPDTVPPGLNIYDVVSLNIVAALEPSTTGLWNIESARPYLPGVSKRFISLIGLIQSHSFDIWLGRLAGLYSVGYITLEARTYQMVGGNPDFILTHDRNVKSVLLGNPRALPRAYLAAPLCLQDTDAVRELIISRSFQPGRQAALECPPGTPVPEAPPTAGELGKVRFIRYEPEHVELGVEASAPAVLVLNDAHYSGWSATVDGQPAPILPANVAVRGVLVPAGTHQVTFTYRTPGQRLGAFLSLGTLGLLGLAVLVERGRRLKFEPAGKLPPT
jgi:hypothetical protein